MRASIRILQNHLKQARHIRHANLLVLRVKANLKKKNNIPAVELNN